jgi:signal transduction histidine kinase
MTALLELTEPEALRRPVAELLEGSPLAPLIETLDAPVKDRTISQLSIGERTYMTSIVTFRAEDGNALGRILTLSDISQVRRLAMEKEKFIRTMVHELKSPLGAVRSIVEVTTDKSLGDDLEAYLPLLHRAENRIDDLVQLIGDLLSLSKSEQAKAASEPQLLEVAPFVDAALTAQAEQMAAHDIAASATVEQELPPVLAPIEDLELILNNLVGNAIKYNREGGTVSVRARHEGEWVRIDVEDTGIGVAVENVDQVFTEFFREKRPETKGLEGSGLGLSIVKRLTERAGGRLQLVSELGKGSTFSVFLPA